MTNLLQLFKKSLTTFLFIGQIQERDPRNPLPIPPCEWRCQPWSHFCWPHMLKQTQTNCVNHLCTLCSASHGFLFFPCLESSTYTIDESDLNWSLEKPWIPSFGYDFIGLYAFSEGSSHCMLSEVYMITIPQDYCICICICICCKYYTTWRLGDCADWAPSPYYQYNQYDL